MVGIYKITSPSKKIYIGQSNNIERRFKAYYKLRCKGQVILYRSFLKHGVEKHKFEIICECIELELNDKERYYQDVYSVLNGKGLNCKLTKSSDRSGKFSEETKLKISVANKGKKRTLEQKEKIKLVNIGRKATKETKLKMSKSRIGFKFSEETKLKMSTTAKKRIFTKEEIKRISTVNIGRKASEETKLKMSKKRKGKVTAWSLKIILDTSNGVFLIGLKEASQYSGIKYNYLSNMLVGRSANKTNLIYV